MKVCKKCKSEFPFWIVIDGKRKNLANRKYCLICSPYGKHNTRPIEDKKQPSQCIKCGNKLFKRQKKYCNNKCQKDFEYSEYIRRWLSGHETGTNGKNSEEQVSSHIHRWVRENRKEQCEKCKWSKKHKVTKKKPLQLHHIDGNPCNNKPENLELLCPNCHSLTDYFGNLNKGNGRKKRYAPLM